MHTNQDENARILTVFIFQHQQIFFTYLTKWHGEYVMIQPTKFFCSRFSCNKYFTIFNLTMSGTVVFLTMRVTVVLYAF